ncbi:hypothetical protein N7450_002298 [Penicillium hetheringtonii]|uniref:Ctl transporter n=1 Tax=Penicillium hetheringtonii TaxID=911720 RepID=A0AAD6GYJ1_9EURO|nr:hypothetical protein N7450_002298 [Penicillium hetheringtonii]
MFSEYASRFLAQSQSRIASRPDELQITGRANPNQRQTSSRNPSSRSFLRTGDPYRSGASQISNFPFASRVSAQPAPLFYGTPDEFREEDDETEREREIADFYALQRSRRNFGDSNLKDSSELDESIDSAEADGGNTSYDNRPGNGKGIKSSWRGEKGMPTTHHSRIETVPENMEHSSGSYMETRDGKTGGNLVDIGLEDSFRPDRSGDQSPSNAVTGADPPIQRFREQPSLNEGFSDFAAASLFATSFLVYLHTSTPSGDKSKWGDTIYFTVHKSFFLLGVYTLVAIFVSLIWLALLRSYVRLLVHVIIVAVPVILYSFSLYPFISSFKGTWHGTSIQDKVMRWGSIVPFLMASLWTYNVLRGRRSIGKAIGVLEFSCRILAANPELLALGLGVLICVVSWTWIWMLMFTRVFLGGHLAGPKSFIIDVGSWWLGVYFRVVLSLVNWSDCRNSTLCHSSDCEPVVLPSSSQPSTVFKADCSGGNCPCHFNSFRYHLPITLGWPTRPTASHSATIPSLITPQPFCLLTNTDTNRLPNQPFVSHIRGDSFAAVGHLFRGLSQMAILAPSAASTSLHPGLSHVPRDLRPLGFGGWVTTARSLTMSSTGGTIKGSLYAYVVGLIAGTIGWSILGSIESVIADIVDALVICWASEVGIYGREARYCPDAGWLFSDHDTSTQPAYRQV